MTVTTQFADIVTDGADVSKTSLREWGTAVETGAGTIGTNLLINGDFQINQRGFAGGALGASVYGFDRWRAGLSGANISVSGYVATMTSGEIRQIIELANWGLASLASTTVTVSVENPSANMTVTFGSASGTLAAGSGRCELSLTTGAGDTGNLTLQLAKATAGTVTFGRVKLEVGSYATEWRARSRTEEFALCQRYFQRFGESLGTVQIRAYQTGGQNIQTTLIFPVEMRTAPTATKVGTWGVSNCGQPTFDATSTRSLRASATVTATGDAYFYSQDSTTYFNLDSEF